MTYSWHNINDSYNNNKVKYSHDGGNSWETINIADGAYSYEDINNYINQYMVQEGHADDDKNKKNPINILFVLSLFRVIIELDDNYKLDLRNSEFGNLLGFDAKLLTETEYGSRFPNITNSIDKINIHSDIITQSILSGDSNNLLAVIPTDNLTRSYSFKFEPRRLLFNVVSKVQLSPCGHPAITDARYYGQISDPRRKL